MKKNLLLLFLVLGIFVGFQSCSDDDDDDTQSNETTEMEVDIDASAYDKWVYFSFEEGETVGETELEEKKEGVDWDIAFHRWDIRLNCGESGSGKGGALLSEDNIAKTGWDALTEAPESGYSVDTIISVVEDVSVMPPLNADVAGSPIITGGSGEGSWMIFNGPPPTYEITNQIFVVKTASGKYAKIWLKQYTQLVDGSQKGGYITMKYSYQSDGSTNLD